MELLFKIQDNSIEEKDAVVLNTNFKDHFPTPSDHLYWLTLKPFIKTATRTLIKFIGQNFYNDIIAESENQSTSSEWDYIIDLSRDAIANYAAWEAMPQLNLIMSDMGVQESVSKEGTSLPVSQWRFKTTRWDTLQKADKALDLLLLFMETQVQEGNTIVDIWKSDPVYKNYRSDFFSSGLDLQNYLNIQESRRTYLALLPYLKKAENKHVSRIVGRDFYADVLANLKDTDYTELISIIKNAIANWAMSMAAPNLALLVESDGFKVVSKTDGFDTKNNALSVFGKEAIDRLIIQAKNDGRGYSAALIKYLYDNVDTFQVWKDSPFYSETGTGKRLIVSEGGSTVLL